MSWSDVFHRIGEVAKNATMATPLGMVFDTAQALGDGGITQLKKDVQQRGVMGNITNSLGLGSLSMGLKTATAPSPEDPNNGFGLLDALHFPYDYGINRPFSTANGVINAAYWDHKNPLSGSLWRKEWNLSDTVSQGQQAAAGSILYREKLGNAAPNSQEAQDYFHHTTVGKIQSGSMDLMANLALDPTLYAGKATKAARLANTTFANATVRDLSFGLGRGNITADQAAEEFGAKVAKKAVKQQTLMDKFLMSTRGMNKTQLMQLAPLRDTSDAGAIAYWLEQADLRAADDAEALAIKRNIFGVVAGNKQSIDELVAKRADLADQMQRMSTPNELTNAEAKFTWDDNGQGMYDFLNAPTLADMQNVDEVGQELARLDRLYNIRHSTSQFAPNALERAQTGARLRDIQESVSYSGMGSRPVRVVRGTVGKAAPGHVNAKIADEGIDELRRTLARSSMDADTRASLLDNFASASSRGARVRAVQEAERAIFRAEGAKFGKTPQEINVLLGKALGRRDTLRSVLRNRLYSAAPDAKYVRHTDEGGYEHAFDRPFLQSQLDDMVPLTDPKILQGVLKREARTGWLGALANGGGMGKDVAEQLASVGTRVWKDAQLFRVAYPMRIQVDTQMRLMASLGALHYVATAGRGFVNMLSNHNFIANDIERAVGKEAAPKASQMLRPEQYGTFVDQPTIDRLQPQIDKLNARLATRNTPRHKPEITAKIKAKRDELQAQVDQAKAAPIMVQPAMDQEQLQQLERTLQGSTFRDLVMGDVNDNILRQLRATGDFDIVKGGDPNWSPSMLRAVNKQIRNSPTAMQVMREGDDHAVADWLRTNRDGYAEWRNFASEYDHDPVPWISMIRAHVNHTIPDPEVRAKVLERPLSVDDLKQHYDDVTSRPAVHGEVYVPFVKSPIATHWENARNAWYKFASDTPEAVMGRHPLYNARFRQHMREIIDRKAGDTITSDDVAQARRVADAKARKDIADTLFDLSSMSNMTHMSRFLSPFFAAWEDTMTKWGRLLYDDPSRAIRLEQAWTAPDKADMTLVDDQGQEYVILPGMFSPFGSKGWRIRKDSFNIVFQGEPWWLPGFGPLVQVPTNEIARRYFPNKADSKAIKYLLPYGVDDTKGTQSRIANQLEPSWFRKAKAAFPGNDQYAQTYAMLMGQELTKYNLGQRKTKPTRQEIANATRNWAIMKTLTAFGAPVSADPTPEFQHYIDMAHRYRDENAQTQAAYQAWKKSGDTTGQPPPRDWEERFYRDYPQYFEMSVSMSTNNTGIVASDKAFQAIQKYRKQIAEHPDLGWLIVGPDNNGDFSQGVYAFQKSTSVGGGSDMTFRGKKSPEDAVNDAESAKGWMDYQKGMTMIQVELEARGLTSLQQKGAEDLAAAKRQFVSDLANQNRAWGAAYGQRNDAKAQSFLREAKDIMASSKDLAKRPDMVALQQYLEGRRMVKAELARRGAVGLPPEDSQNSPNADLRIAWDQFTASLIANNIGFEQMWNRALEADSLRDDI